MTDAESLAYDTGMALRLEDRPMAGDASAAACLVCRAAQRLHSVLPPGQTPDNTPER